MLLFINNYLPHIAIMGRCVCRSEVQIKGAMEDESVEESSYTDEDNSEPTKRKIFLQGAESLLG